MPRMKRGMTTERLLDRQDQRTVRAIRARSQGLVFVLRNSVPRPLVGLVDQPHGARAVVDADRWRRAALPVFERIAHRGEIGRGDGGARESLVTLGGGELHDPVLHRENGVAAGDLPLAVSAVARKAVADLDGAENAARRAKHDRSVVLDRALMGAAAQLRASPPRTP